MIRSALLWASTNPFTAGRLPRYGFVQRAVRRFMPGERLADAVPVAEELQADGFRLLMTELGENVDSVAAARAVADGYLTVAETVARRELDCEVSVKPTHLGLEQGLEVCVRHLTDIARSAPGIVWIDMEDSSCLESTLEVYEAVRSEVENVGLCLQAYLRRTPEDLDRLLPHTPHIRLVKGAYHEPSELAFEKKREVDAAYRKLASRMLRERRAGRMGRVCLGTHDDAMIQDAARVAGELGLPATDWEVAMLYGIRPEAQRSYRDRGVTVRILISYGAQWFPWYMRRLAERPANVGFVLRSMVRG